MSDESLREFQLNGKQLVFLFMASTIVAVVIFLCGVMVGRGVEAAQMAAVTNSTVETGDPTAGELPAVPAAAPTSPTDVAPETPGDDPDLKYPEALTGDKPDVDLEPAKSVTKIAPVAVPPAAAPTANVVKTNAPVVTPSVEPGAAEPAGDGFVVQVAATPRRAEADAIRARLEKKGYPTFVTTAGRLFRVRVGKYKDRAEATAVSKRLETEERFKPWVTR